MATNDDHTIGIIGAGSAAETLVKRLSDSDHRIVVFEPHLVGGECPFLACMPSKSMLHDRTTGRDWAAAIARRDEIVSHLDDEQHAGRLDELGATLVRERATIAGPGRIAAGETQYAVDHVVIATGAAPIFPDVDGLDADHARVWTSREALTVDEQPASVVVLGGGVVGSELAFMFAGFGTEATTLDMAERQAADMHPQVGELIEATLQRAGVTVVNGIEADRVELTDDAAAVHLADGSVHSAERLIVATGRAPKYDGLGLDTIGVDSDDVAVDDTGRLVGADGDVHVIGDAAGFGQYTHVANHHAAVVANHIAGDGSRSYGESVVPACIFLDPPVMSVGPTWAELDGDPDVVWAEIDLDQPRNATDEHADGFLAVAARRSTGMIVAANGIGARFDELVHALVIAIDGNVPVSRLVTTIQPFPTVGGVLSTAFGTLQRELDG